jgi:uncharacterized repeat protein (TIGR03803 family)
MSPTRAFLLAAALALFLSSPGHAAIGIEPLPDQDIPSGKTLVIPIPATDPAGPARTYTVSVGTPTVTGSSSVVASSAGITAAIRTGDPHFLIGVSYTDSNSVQQTGTMEYQLLREFTPLTTQIIGGLVQAGYYSPQTGGTAGTTYLQFGRIVPGFVIQLGTPSGDGRGGPGFTFENEFSSALIFSGTEGQMAMANGGTGPSGGTNGSQFFITLAPQRSLDFKHTNFGQLLRGFDTLNGIAGTAISGSAVDLGGGDIEFSEPQNPVNITSATITRNDTDAVLLLSATGVCDSVITVTASSGASVTTGTFTAHAVADTFSDPPFLRPVPDMTAPNGILNVALLGTDLQLDLLAYGYERILPVADGPIVTGTSPLVPFPLVSNTDNDVAATLDHINPSARGNDLRVFHIGAGSKPLRGTLNPVPNGRDSITSSPSQGIAVITAGNAGDTAASFSGSINWGDGTFVSGSNIHILPDGTGKTVHRFTITNTHTYTTPGEYPVIVKLADAPGAHLTLTGTANISSSSIAISSPEIYKTGGVLKNEVVATFDDNTIPNTAADYTATINWGDGTTSPGTLKAGANFSYKVLGTHTYKTPDTFTVTTTVTRTSGGSYSAGAWAGAHIAGIIAPQVFPPFPQAHLAQIFSVIYSDSNAITSTGTTGGIPIAPLATGSDGNFYGTTQGGGPANDGTVYQLTASGSLATIYNFTGGADGSDPRAGLLSSTDGFLYGTAETGGTNGTGTIYQVTTSGSFNIVHSFGSTLSSGTDSDGAQPTGGIILAADGFLYGTASVGGTGGGGTVYQVSVDGTAGPSFTTIYAFSPLTGGSNSDGVNPFAGVIQASDGNLYGTAEAGGTNGLGTIFQLTTSGSINVLHTFAGGNGDGANPVAGLVQASDQNLYGVTENGGGSGEGAVFQISTSGSFTILHSFTGGSDGANPQGTLIQANDGNLYGTTENGGTNGGGTVFQISTGGAFNALFSFPANTGGRNPAAGVTQGADLGLYGTTQLGGAAGVGTAYRITTTGSFAQLASFGSGSTSQVALRFSVAIVNSGNKTSAPGSYSVYIDPSGTIDGQQTLLTSNGQGAFPIPALKPGALTIFSFRLEGSVVDTRLKAPPGFDPGGQSIVGVVTYSDPVGDFDGSQKIISPPGMIP